jgi:uncharacterized protein YggT (Ycf19 family)
MRLIDFILNIIGLLLWLNWLSTRFNPLIKSSPTSLVATLRKADPSGSGNWQSLVGIAVLILARALVYWQMSPTIRWNPRLDLGVISLSFRSDNFWRMLLFSLFGFAIALAFFYFWVLLLSVVNSRLPDTDPIQKLIRHYFRWFDSWPNALKVLLPFFAGALLWLLLQPLLAHLLITTKVRTFAQLFGQAAVMGTAAYLTWKYLIVGILLLHLVNSYVYLGNHPLWNFVNATAANLLYPIRWLPLRVGKVDFLPILAVAIVFYLTELVTNPPPWFRQWFYHVLPF